MASYLGATVLAVLLAGCVAAACDGLIFGTGENNPFALTMWSMRGLVAVLLSMVPACITAGMFWWIAVRGRSGTTAGG